MFMTKLDPVMNSSNRCLFVTWSLVQRTAGRFWTSTHSYEMTQRVFHASKCQLLVELETVLGIVTSKYTSGRYGPQSQGRQLYSGQILLCNANGWFKLAWPHCYVRNIVGSLLGRIGDSLLLEVQCSIFPTCCMFLKSCVNASTWHFDRQLVDIMN
jgi:hypothetical protein